MSLIAKRMVLQGAISGTANDPKVDASFPGVVPPYMASLIITALGGSTSLVVKIQHSPDNGVTWFDLVSFAAKTLVGSELVAITGPMLPTIRAVRTFTGGTATATLEVAVHAGVK